MYAQSPDDLTHRYARLANPSWTDEANDLRALLERRGKVPPPAARALADSLTAEIDARPQQSYPNPSNGRLVVDLPLAAGETVTVTLTLYDLTGRRVFRQTTSARRYEQVAELPAGVYLLSAEFTSGRVMQRVVVR